jgi:hypothetical protein
VAVVIRTVAIPLVKPALVLALELVIEDDSIDTRPTVCQALGGAFVGAIDLEVVLPLSLAFQAIPKRLAVTLATVSMTFEEAAACLRQRDGMFAGAGHASCLNETLFAQVPQVP